MSPSEQTGQAQARSRWLNELMGGPFLAQSGHPDHWRECLLSEVKQTLAGETESPLLTQSGHSEFRIFAGQIARLPVIQKRLSFMCASRLISKISE
jgi:hypothetical protein